MATVIDQATRMVERQRQAPPAGLSVVDTDIHHGFHDNEDLYPYLSPLHQERLANFGLLNGGIYLQNGGTKGRRADTIDPADPKDSETTALNPDKVREHLLDPCGVRVAILTGAQTYTASAMTDLDYASALCRAFNDFTIDHWLAG